MSAGGPVEISRRIICTVVRFEALPAAKAEWSDEAVLASERSVPQFVDDTSSPKKGKHSVGVARQSCRELGKEDNFQIAVSLSVANDKASLPIAYWLYLPETWANDRARRARSVASLIDGSCTAAVPFQRRVPR